MPSVDSSTPPSERYKTLVIDGKNLVVRNFYAFTEALVADGQSTNLLHGAFLELFRYVAKWQPETVIVTWDSLSRFRRAIHPGYKAVRRNGMNAASFANFQRQYEIFREGLSCLGVTELMADGVEGDDLVALAANRRESRPVLIVSSDHDFWQLVRAGGVSIYDARTKGILSATNFASVTGFDSPDHHLAFKVIRGDGGDGVPPAVLRFGDAKAKVAARQFILPRIPTLWNLQETEAIAYSPETPKLTGAVLEETERRLARNFKLVCLHAALLLQKEILATLSFEPRRKDWTRFIQFCARYQLKQVGLAYGEVDKLI